MAAESWELEHWAAGLLWIRSLLSRCQYCQGRCQRPELGQCGQSLSRVLTDER